MRERTNKEIPDDLEQLLGTRGGRLWGSWHSLDDAAFLLRRNADDILRVEEQINNNPRANLEIGSEENREQTNFVLLDLNRRLHNFVASAETLEAHIRRHLGTNYKGDQLESNYDLRREELFKNEPVCHLIIALRNVSLHYGLPEVRVKFSVSFVDQPRTCSPHGSGREGPLPTVTFVLDRLQVNALIRATTRTRQYREALEFLEQNAPELSVVRLVERYTSASLPLLNWLREESNWREDEEVKQFFDCYNKLVREFNREPNRPFA